MKLTPNPIEAKRYLQIIRDDSAGGYIIRKEVSYSGKPNVIHLEFSDTDINWIEEIFPQLKQYLINWKLNTGLRADTLVTGGLIK